MVYILGAQKNRLIEMVLHMFQLKTFKAYIPISFCVFKDISFTVASLDFRNSCKRLQNRKDPIYNHGFISWVLKRTVSLRRHF